MRASARPVLRPAVEGDMAFLRDLYGQTRAEEMALSGWVPDRCEAFLDSQFDLQFRHYSSRYPEGRHLIVERARRPVGRLWLADEGQDRQIVDISLIESARGQGLGAALLRQVMARARRDGLGVSLSVLADNIGAQRLYLRLGFRVVEASGPRWRMRWTPPVS